MRITPTSPSIPTRKAERFCTTCRRPFNSWGEPRDRCWVCQPKDRIDTLAFKAAIASGDIRL